MTEPYWRTLLGEMRLGDALWTLGDVPAESVDLIMTSPPFALVTQKRYGNARADDYLEWFRAFAILFRRLLKPTGSLVIDMGGGWNRGQPTRSLVHLKLPIMLVEEYDFVLCQEFYWWNPSKLPTPAEWVTVRRVRVKDAVDPVWWLSRSPYPKADNRRVAWPYSERMQALLSNGETNTNRPSGHELGRAHWNDRGSAISPNLIALPNTESNGAYQQYCREHNLTMHPARFPAALPEYFIRMCTDAGDLVLDPFAGSCTTGAVCERLKRRWICCDDVEEYLAGAVGRFSGRNERAAGRYYQVPGPGLLWEDDTAGTLATGERRKLG